jgi:hypothetical protein
MTSVPVTDLAWTFDPDRSDGGVLVDSIDSDMPEYKPGKSFSMDFVFWQNTQDTATIKTASGGTAGGPRGFTMGGPNGATLGSTEADPSGIPRYEKVREYSRWAGRFVLDHAIDGTPRFTEHTPDSATVDSIVVKLVPGDGLAATDGLWVLIDDVDDRTRFAKDTARIGLTMTVLARGDEYATRTDIRNTLGSDL